MTVFITCKRPETTAVRGKHFITDHNFAIFIQTEFKFGISDDDTACQGIISTFFIKRNRIVTNLNGIFFTMTGELFFQNRDTLFKVDIFIMVADFCFCTGRIDGFRQFVTFFKTCREFDSAYGTIFLIALPAAACDISAYDALNRKHGQFAAQHTVAIKPGLTEIFRHIFYVNTEHVIWNDVFGVIEPESGHLGQNSTFFYNFVLKDDIECRDAVSCDHDKTVTIIIDLTYFAFFDRFEFFHTCSPFLDYALFRLL